MKTRIAAVLGALAVVVLTGSVARADYVPFSYNFSPVNPTSPPFPGVPSPLPTLTSNTTNAPGEFPEPSKILLSNEPSVPEAATSDIVATNISVISSAVRNHEDLFLDGGSSATSNGGFALRLNIKDLGSGAETGLDFHGRFVGNVSSTSANLDVLWDNDYSQATPLVFTLGNSEYSVFLRHYSPPGPPSAGLKGGITFHVDARPLDVQKAPEPSTMVLSCVGLSLMGLAGWRKRRQLKAQAQTEAAV
jgi:hypothetical protein